MHLVECIFRVVGRFGQCTSLDSDNTANYIFNCPYIYMYVHVMLLLENVYTVLEVAEGRLCLCKSFGCTLHGLMCGTCVYWV